MHKGRRQRICKTQRFPDDGVAEGQEPGVKGKTARQLWQLFPIQEIAAYRAAHVAKMDPDLMGAACFQLQADQGTAAGCHDCFIAGDRHFAFWMNDPADGWPVLFDNGHADDSLWRAGDPLCDCQVLSDKAVLMEHLLKLVLHQGCFGDRHEPTGPPIQPVHRPEHVGDMVGDSGAKNVFQRITRMMAPRGGSHGCGLGYDEQMLILIGNVQRHGAGDGAVSRRRIFGEEGHHIPWLQQVVNGRGYAVYQDAPCPFGRLDGTPADAHGAVQQCTESDA